MKRKVNKLALNTLESLTVSEEKQIDKQKFQKQNIEEKQQDDPQVTSSSQEYSQPKILPAVLEMQFRKRRGTRIKQLMNIKINKKDLFWQKNQRYFGGNLNFAQDEDSQQDADYELSSEGIDSFDSDFGDDIKWKRNKSSVGYQSKSLMQNQIYQSGYKNKGKKQQIKQKKARKKQVQNCKLKEES